MKYPNLKSAICFLLFLILFTACSKKLRPQQLLIDVKELSSDKYEGRKTGTAGNQLAIEYLSKRFQEIGLKPFSNSFKHAFNIKNKKGVVVNGTNVLGYIQGKKEDVFVISAHFDHIGVINGRIYNGADDNASGVAAMLFLAKYFTEHQPQQTLVFAAFDAEEIGFLGAKAFIDNPPLDINRIILNVNLDMVSRADNGILYAAGSSYYPKLKKYLTTSNSKIKLVTGHDDPKSGKADWTNQSDHSVFHKKGIPFIYFGVDNHSDYHKTTDDFKRINKERFQACADIILEVVTNMDKGISLQKSFREKLIME